MKNKFTVPKPAGWLAGLLLTVPTAMQAEPQSLLLKYDRPAQYFEEALVLGNGRLGATVYGGVGADKISLNDITLWTGEPNKEVVTPDAWQAIADIRALLDAEDYVGAAKAQRRCQGKYSENYQPLGELTMTHLSMPEAYDTTSYYRQLDLADATAHVQYRRNGVAYDRDYFVSAPDSVIVIRLRASQPRALHTQLSYRCQLPATVSVQADRIIVDGYAAYHSLPSYYKRGEEHFFYDPDRGVHFRTVIQVIPIDGRLSVVEGDRLDLTGCSEALVLISNATSFNGFDKDPVREGRLYKEEAVAQLKKVALKSYNTLRQAHIADYRHFFDRLQLDLGRTDARIAAMTTDRQLRLYTDSAQINPELEALYFQYGRYLLISCSRTEGVPANLQGLWNEKILPPWSCNYTSNINLEENYWAAETANLSEMHDPLLRFIGHLAQTGGETARHYYHVDKGWCLAHNTDMWALTNPVGMHAGSPEWANWTMGGAWLSTHIWEHYQFTQDKAYLREAYPLLKGAADFCLGWLIEKNGRLMTSPGVSPENLFKTPDGVVSSTSYGNAADLAMIRECLIDTREAARTLGIDRAYRKQIDATLAQLQPYQVGSNGNLQEWYHDWQDNDPQHRHQSHLFGLYPGHHLSVSETPELAKACARTLEIKGDKTTGWSTGWRVNLYARLQEGEAAYHIYRMLLNYISPDGYKGADARRGGGTYPNLLDAHSPFQIDGNFGGCAGVLEMLVQSDEKQITLLPALPQAWSQGSLKGVCARGGFVLDLSWQAGRITALSITSRQGGKTRICMGDRVESVKLKAGETKSLKF